MRATVVKNLRAPLATRRPLNLTPAHKKICKYIKIIVSLMIRLVDAVNGTKLNFMYVRVDPSQVTINGHSEGHSNAAMDTGPIP